MSMAQRGEVTPKQETRSPTVKEEARTTSTRAGVTTRSMTAAERGDELGPDTIKYRQAVMEVLRRAQQFMDPGDIATHAVCEGLLQGPVVTVEGIVSRLLSTDAQRGQPYSMFKRSMDGGYGLREWSDDADSQSTLPDNQQYNGEYTSGNTGGDVQSVNGGPYHVIEGHPWQNGHGANGQSRGPRGSIPYGRMYGYDQAMARGRKTRGGMYPVMHPSYGYARRSSQCMGYSGMYWNRPPVYQGYGPRHPRNPWGNGVGANGVGRMGGRSMQRGMMSRNGRMRTNILNIALPDFDIVEGVLGDEDSIEKQLAGFEALDKIQEQKYKESLTRKAPVPFGMSTSQQNCYANSLTNSGGQMMDPVDAARNGPPAANGCVAQDPRKVAVKEEPGCNGTGGQGQAATGALAPIGDQNGNAADGNPPAKEQAGQTFTPQNDQEDTLSGDKTQSARTKSLKAILKESCKRKRRSSVSDEMDADSSEKTACVERTNGPEEVVMQDVGDGELMENNIQCTNGVIHAEGIDVPKASAGEPLMAQNGTVVNNKFVSMNGGNGAMDVQEGGVNGKSGAWDVHPCEAT